jgi:V-type H+-transporting ATPase subunit D
LQQKIRLIGAKKGFELLKKKVDALKTNFRKILVQILEVKKSMGKEFSEAMFGLAEANYAAGEFRYMNYSSINMCLVVMYLIK